MFKKSLVVEFPVALKDQEAKVGERVEMTCETSVSVEKVTWYHQDRIEIEGDRYILTSTGGTKHQLIIRCVSTRDKGIYACTVGSNNKKTSGKLAVKGLQI